jgi:triosephosphate isomerase
MARKALIAGNWKMNKTPSEALETAKAIAALDLDAEVEALLCVPAIDLPAVAEGLKGTNIGYGAENMYFEESGAYTGEISPLMLKDLDCQYVILGHSERRQIFGESDELIGQKLQSALVHDLKPILCVGETLEEREAGQQEARVKAELDVDLKGLAAQAFDKITIAYEPIWAIGTGKTASPEDAEEMCAFIRQQVEDQFGVEAGQAVRILYGGSVKPANVKEIMAKDNVDGALVGGASLKADSFQALVNFRE